MSVFSISVLLLAILTYFSALPSGLKIAQLVEKNLTGLNNDLGN